MTVIFGLVVLKVPVLAIVPKVILSISTRVILDPLAVTKARLFVEFDRMIFPDATKLAVPLTIKFAFDAWLMDPLVRFTEMSGAVIWPRVKDWFPVNVRLPLLPT